LLLNAVLRRRCCWVPAAVDRYLLLARRSAANLPHAAAAVIDGSDGRTPARFVDPAFLLRVLCGSVRQGRIAEALAA